MVGATIQRRIIYWVWNCDVYGQRRDEKMTKLVWIMSSKNYPHIYLSTTPIITIISLHYSIEINTWEYCSYYLKSKNSSRSRRTQGGWWWNFLRITTGIGKLNFPGACLSKHKTIIMWLHKYSMGWIYGKFGNLPWFFFLQEFSIEKLRSYKKSVAKW